MEDAADEYWDDVGINKIVDDFKVEDIYWLTYYDRVELWMVIWFTLVRQWLYQSLFSAWCTLTLQVFLWRHVNSMYWETEMAFLTVVHPRHWGRNEARAAFRAMVTSRGTLVLAPPSRGFTGRRSTRTDQGPGSPPRCGRDQRSSVQVKRPMRTAVYFSYQFCKEMCYLGCMRAAAFMWMVKKHSNEGFTMQAFYDEFLPQYYLG